MYRLNFSMVLRGVLAIGLMASATVSKADVIVLKDGTTIQAENIDISSKWIYYTELGASVDDVKKVANENVFGYKIGEGSMVAINGETSAPQSDRQNDTDASKGPVFVEPVAAPENAALISAYNNHPPVEYVGKKPQPDKYTNEFLSIWGIEENSILSDQNVEISFEKVYSEGNKDRHVLGHIIRVTNKTDKPVYIDLASCYKIMNGNYAEPYFTNSVYTEGSSSTSGGSLNLGAVAGALGVGGVLGTLAGGMNVGKANTKSTSISKAEQQILIIPPHGAVKLPGHKVSDGKEILECYEPIYLCNRPIPARSAEYSYRFKHMNFITVYEDMDAQKEADAPGATKESLNIRRWVQTDYTPEQSPKKIGRLITYSTSPDFATYTTLPVNIYMRGAFGFNSNSSFIGAFNDKTYKGITDKEHFICGYGYLK